MEIPWPLELIKITAGEMTQDMLEFFIIKRGSGLNWAAILMGIVVMIILG